VLIDVLNAERTVAAGARGLRRSPGKQRSGLLATGGQVEGDDGPVVESCAMSIPAAAGPLCSASAWISPVRLAVNPWRQVPAANSGP